MTAMTIVPWGAVLAVAALATGCSQIIGIEELPPVEDLPPVEELAPVGRWDPADLQAVRFGYSVSLSGVLMAVGAPDDTSADTGIGGNPARDGADGSGAVYMYVFRQSDTSWDAEEYIKASNTGAHAHFGESVSLAGDILVVGAPYEDSAATGIDGDQNGDGARDSGAVYVFRRNGGSWQQEAYVKASNSSALGHFGWSVSASVSELGEIFAVGAPDQGGSGTAYVFRRSGESWIEETVIEAPRAGEADRFGDSVSISGDMLAVGASEEDSAATGIDGQEDDNQATESGAVYVFQRSDGIWVRDAYVKASNTGAGDVFGASVSLSGDALAVGAYGEDSAAATTEDDDSVTDSGAVYVFQRGSNSWGQTAFLKASSPGASDHFGWSVAISADILVAGAPGEDSAATGVDGDQGSEGAADSGAAYVFQRAGDSWDQSAYVKANSPGAGANFGTSVSATDTELAVGVPCEAVPAWPLSGVTVEPTNAFQRAESDMEGGHCIGRGAVYLFQLKRASGGLAAWCRMHPCRSWLIGVRRSRPA